MRGRFFRATISAATIAAIINSSQIQTAEAQEIRIPNPLGLLLKGLGIKTYKLTPAYRNFLAPYIKNEAVYDKLISDYTGKKRFSGRAGINVIIKVGILKKHPEWLTSGTLDEIRKYYPVRENRTELPDLKFGYTQPISYEFSYFTENDFPLHYAEAVPGVGVGVAAGLTTAELISALQFASRAVPLALELPVAAGAAALTVAAIAVFELNRDSLFQYLTPEAQALVLRAESTVCQNIDGGCSYSTSPNSRGHGDVSCEQVIRNCLAECAERFSNNPNTLPGRGPDRPSRLRKCVRECVEPFGCSY